MEKDVTKMTREILLNYSIFCSDKWQPFFPEMPTVQLASNFLSKYDKKTGFNACLFTGFSDGQLITISAEFFTVLVNAPVSSVKLERFQPGNQPEPSVASQRSAASFVFPPNCLLSAALTSSSACSLFTRGCGCC